MSNSDKMILQLSWFLFLGYGKVLLLCDGIIFVYYQYVMKMSINI